MTKVLLIDDDETLGELLTDYFARFGIELLCAIHPKKGLSLLEEETPALVVLDIMLPELDGLEVCRRIRHFSDIPIVMLTARGDVMDRIVGLELGADDYLAKPFEPRELVARIQNILKRASGPKKDFKGMIFGELLIDPVRQQVKLADELLDLSTMEYQLLMLLAKSPGKVFNRDEILNKLKGIEAEIFSRSVDIAVSRLRQKLNDTEKPPKFIKTVWGTGYTFIGAN